MNGKVAIFELSGKFGHFKIPETTRGALSFPFPPRTALMGILAGILGFERNSYWKEGHPLRDAKIAIEVVNPIRMYPLKVNYTQTKSDFILRFGEAKLLLPSDPLAPGRRGFTTQYRLDLVKDPLYRIYLSIEDTDVFEKLVMALRNHHYVYPPYLGHANMLAQIDFIGTYDYVSVPPGEYSVVGVIPLSVVDLDSDSVVAGDFHIIHGVPMSLRIKKELPSLDGRYIAVTEPELIDSVAFHIEGLQKAIKLQTSKKGIVIQVSLEDKKRNIVFLPRTREN